jgi:hypothetical protein
LLVSERFEAGGIVDLRGGGCLLLQTMMRSVRHSKTPNAQARRGQNIYSADNLNDLVWKRIRRLGFTGWSDCHNS